jgi:hypothetical protein
MWTFPKDVLGSTLRDIKVRENPVVQIEIARLREELTALNVSIDRLANTRTILTDEAIGQLGRAVTDTLMKMRACASKDAQMQHDLSDNAAETRETAGNDCEPLRLIGKADIRKCVANANG